MRHSRKNKILCFCLVVFFSNSTLAFNPKASEHDAVLFECYNPNPFLSEEFEGIENKQYYVNCLHKFSRLNSKVERPPEKNHKALKTMEQGLVIFSNLTWGLPNTLIGTIFVVVDAAAAPFTDKAELNDIEFADSGLQISARVIIGTDCVEMSLGIWKLYNCEPNPKIDFHEAGHAKQSAILGPFYLLFIGSSYVIEGRKKSFMEKWAND